MTSTLTAQAASRGLPRVLLVDDEPSILAILRRQLRNHYEIVTATDGPTGLELLQHGGPFAAVVSDMSMPIMDGATFLAGARAAARDTVRILLTGQSDIDAVVDAVNRGQIFRFLSKPCPAEVLQACLRDAVDQHHLSQARTESLERATRTVPSPRITSDTAQAVAALEQALATHQLVVWYQPIVDLHSQRIVGAEALIRWQHPERGLVPPAEFLPFAEQSGVIVPIGRWVLEQSFADAATWPDSGGLPYFLAVNVSTRQVCDPAFVDDVRNALLKSTLGAGSVKLEITESTLLEDPRQAGRTLQRLRDFGIEISVDDFGTGICSLSNIRDLPIDEFKIARSFVESLPEATSVAVAETIIHLGRNLGLGIIAKGIETTVQWDAVRNLGCHLGQGFLFGKPMDHKSFKRALSPGSKRIKKPRT
jgi:EAL domain-containing protein (putative c-di-GMP-specific phosphodiesterase class I)/CheY-like chemotaxis protein